MIELPLPAGVEPRLIETSRRPVPALRGLPRPGADNGIDVVMASGAEIGAGSMILGLIAAANRDPAQVKEPEAFEVTREQVPSLSFGAGPHYCLGAYLAGLQGEVLFPRMLRRFPGLRLAGQPVYRSPGSTLRGLEHLPLYVTS